MKWNITLLIITSMICITLMMLYALSKGFDGVLTTGTIAIVAGLATGYITKKRVRKNNE